MTEAEKVQWALRIVAGTVRALDWRREFGAPLVERDPGTGAAEHNARQEAVVRRSVADYLAGVLARQETRLARLEAWAAQLAPPDLPEISPTASTESHG